MISHLQIANHIRGDGLRVLGIFNVEGWGPWPCQLCADVGKKEVFALGMRKSKDGSRWTLMSSAVVDAALAAYDNDMSAIFGEEWRTIDDGTTRLLEWSFTRAA